MFVIGTAGHVAVEGLGGSYGTETLTFGRRRAEGGPPEVELEAYPGPDESWHREWEEFVQAVTEGRAYQGAPGEGVAVMRVLDALYASARTGQPVIIPPPAPAPDGTPGA